ncbi:MAG: hypothetical protein ACYSWP_05860 [Planctomycetota bacterium]
MLENENDLKNLIDKLNIDTKANPNHREELRRKMLAAFDESHKSTRSLRTVRSIIMKSKITKLAAAAVVAIALLVPLSYGTSIIIKNLMASHGTDNFKGQFKLNKNIHIDVRIGTKEERKIVTAGNIRFFKDGQRLLGTLRCSVCSWPKFKWRTKITLVDTTKTVLNSTEQIRENSGLKPKDHAEWFGLSIHFSLGSWNNLSQAQTFRITLDRVGEDIETTVDDWVESTELPVLHGRVIGPDSKPIANATVQIREKRKPGQRSIAAPEVTTDNEGYYSFDEIEWPYRVGLLTFQHEASGQGYKHQYKRLNRVLEGTQAIDFSFDQFPTGNAILTGKVAEPNGVVIQDFTVDVRNKVDWKDYTGKYLYQFGIEKPFVGSDGRFEIPGLPAGKYTILIVPRERQIYDYFRRFDCELVDGITTEAVIETERKNAFYGRILYENGKPAVPKTQPWKGAKVCVFIRYTPATGTDGGHRERLGDVDSAGYFSFYLTDEQYERLGTGEYRIEILHPSYEEEYHSYVVGTFPTDMLVIERNNAKGYIMPYDNMSPELKNLKQQFDSLEKLNELGPSLSAYQVSEPHKLPMNLDDIRAYLSDELIRWARENIDYFSIYPNTTDYEATEIGFAYDKTLLEKTQGRGTNVLFLDGHVDFCRTRRLRGLGLDRPAK